MKFDFSYYNPTKIYFGKDSLLNLKKELKNYKENILLVYGKGSVKKNGIYDKVLDIIKSENKNIFEVSGIQSNPTYNEVLKGAKIIRENDISLIIAMGGGSVIDCAKAMSASAYIKEDPWEEYWEKKQKVKSKITPLCSILTMAGTGSEMNGGSVITNEEKKIKTGAHFQEELFPKFSILNPEFTYTVPYNQMVSGIFDCFSHLMEQYFSGDDDNTTDYIIEGIMKALIRNAKVAVKDSTDYEARSNIMWCATVALNSLTGLSKEQDWEVHQIEHQTAVYKDCPHGIGLGVISPAYYRYILKDGLMKFKRFAINVWNVNTENKSDIEIANEGIDCLEEFIRMLKIPKTLRELGVTEDMLPKIAKSCRKGGGYKKLEYEDILCILKSSY